jgi:hypothetical protein
MGTNRYVEELEYSDAKGLDTASPVNLLASGYVREARNVNLGVTGGYIKRNGYAPQLTLANVVGGKSIRAGIEYRTSLGNSEIILYATDNANPSSIGVINSLGVYVPLQNDSGSQLSLTTDARPSFAQLQDTLYYFDGSGNIDTPFAYESNASYTRPLGVELPSTVATPVAVGSGGSLNQGDYIYAVTYVFYLNNQIIAESSPSNLVEISTVSNDSVTLTLPTHPAVQSASSAYSHLQIGVRIWRTVVNGNILFLENPTFVAAGSSGNATFTYTSTASDDALLSEQMPFDNTRLKDYQDYDRARFPVVARNRLLVFHPNQNRGRFSKISLNGPLPESFPVQNEFSIEGKYGAADALVGAGQIKGIPIILKERSIGRLEEIGLPDLGNSEDNVAYLYREISEVTGAVSHFAQCQVFDELIFLGRDNVYATDGQNVRPIASPIQDVIKNGNYSFGRDNKVSAINDSKNRRVYIQICKDDTTLEPDLTLVGDYQQYPTFRWTTYGEGDNKVTQPGIKAGCFFQTEATATGGLDIYFGSATRDGQYYKMNTGDSDLKTDWDPGTSTAANVEYPIAMRLVSRPYMFGQPLVTKLYKKAKIFAEARDNSYNFFFGAKFDLDVFEEEKSTFTALGSGTYWSLPAPDEYEWFDGVNVSEALIWAGPALQEFQYHVHRKAQIMQLVFTQDTIDAPLTLLGWGVSGSIFSGI